MTRNVIEADLQGWSISLPRPAGSGREPTLDPLCPAEWRAVEPEMSGRVV
jgi:hypothetical protein